MNQIIMAIQRMNKPIIYCSWLVLVGLYYLGQMFSISNQLYFFCALLFWALHILSPAFVLINRKSVQQIQAIVGLKSRSFWTFFGTLFAVIGVLFAINLASIGENNFLFALAVTFIMYNLVHFGFQNFGLLRFLETSSDEAKSALLRKVDFIYALFQSIILLGLVMFATNNRYLGGLLYLNQLEFLKLDSGFLVGLNFSLFFVYLAAYHFISGLKSLSIWRLSLITQMAILPGLFLFQPKAAVFVYVVSHWLSSIAISFTLIKIDTTQNKKKELISLLILVFITTGLTVLLVKVDQILKSTGYFSKPEAFSFLVSGAICVRFLFGFVHFYFEKIVYKKKFISQTN